MCYETAQLAYRIYREAIRMNASPEEIDALKTRWKELERDHKAYYHVSGYEHPSLLTYSIENGALSIVPRTWGLIPDWVHEEEQAAEIQNKTLNARGESIFEKPSFKDAAAHHRCIIPVEGFFEYHHKKGKSFPYFIRRTDKERLFLGGLTSVWTHPVTGQKFDTFTIVTTKGNGLMTEVHNNPKLKEARMPLLINDDDSKLWLEGSTDEIAAIIQANDAQPLEAYTVKQLKGKNAVGNTPDAQVEYSYPELYDPPTLF